MPRQIPEINRLEVKVFILRHYRSQAEFCRQAGLNLECFRAWMHQRRPLTKYGAAVLKAARKAKYPLRKLYEKGANHEA